MGERKKTAGENKGKKKLAVAVALALTLGTYGQVEASSGFGKGNDLNTNNKIYFGTYLQDSKHNGNKGKDSDYLTQGVSYSVVKNNSNANRLVLYSDKILFGKKYKSDTFAGSELYNSLNTDKDSFLNTSFSSQEQGAIAQSTILTSKLPTYTEYVGRAILENYEIWIKGDVNFVGGDADIVDKLKSKTTVTSSTQKIYIPSYDEIKEYNLNSALKTLASEYAWDNYPALRSSYWSKWYLRDKGIIGPEFVTANGYIFVGGNYFSHDDVFNKYLDSILGKLVSQILSSIYPAVGILSKTTNILKNQYSVLGIRPAFQLDTSQILYTTDASSKTSGKAAASTNGGFISPSAVGANSTVKLTLKDYYDAKSNPNGQQKISYVTLTNTDNLGMIYDVGKKYEGTKADNQIIALLIGNTDFNDWTYYANGGKLANGSVTASGTASIANAGLPSGTYGLSIYSEQANGYDRTDYAGETANMFNIEVSGGAIEKLILVGTDTPLTVSSKDAVVYLADGKEYKAQLEAKNKGAFMVSSGVNTTLDTSLALNDGYLSNEGTTTIAELYNYGTVKNAGTLNLKQLANYNDIIGSSDGVLNLTGNQTSINKGGNIEQKIINIEGGHKLTNSGSMKADDTINILAGATVTNTGLLHTNHGGINNAGTLTSKLGTNSLEGTFTNTGTFYLTGDISADVLGSGTTVLKTGPVQVAGDRTIAGTLKTNGKTLNMQDSNFAKLNVGNLVTESNSGLKIDIDIKNNGSDKATATDAINITGDAANSSGTVNLTGINVTGELSAGNYTDYVNYVTGNNSNLTYQLNGGTSSVLVASEKGSVTLSLGSKGYLNASIGGIDTGVTLQQFIRGAKNPEALTYVINSDQTINQSTDYPSEVGTTQRDTARELNLNINNGATVTANTDGYSGITVADGYTLNVNGSVNGTKTATMTKFTNPITNNGTANITDMVFSGNYAGDGKGVLTNTGNMTLDNVIIKDSVLTGSAQDIVNTGTLVFSDHMSSLAKGISDGGDGSKGTVEFWNVDATPDFTITQKEVDIDEGASLTTTADKLKLSGEILNNGKFVFTAGSTDNPYTLNNAITHMVDNQGTTTFTAGSNIVANADITQNTVVNEGTLTANADKLKGVDATAINNGTLQFTGGTMNATTTGNGTVVVDGAVTAAKTITQKTVQVKSGKSLTANADITANITNEGKLVNSETATITATNVKNSSSGTMQNEGIVQTANLENTGAITGNGGTEITSAGTNSGTLEQGVIGIDSGATLINTGTVTSALASVGTLQNQGTANIYDIDNSGTVSGSGTLNLYSTGDNSGTIEQNVINVEDEGEFYNTGTVKANVINVLEGGLASGLTVDKVLNVEGTILDTTINSDGVMNYATSAGADNITLKGTMQLTDLTGSGSNNYGMGDLVGDGGTINLAENSGTSYSTPGRNLSINSARGNVTFNINANLANNIADNVTVSYADNLTANLKVVYDPYYSNYNPLDANTVPYGKARVLTIGSGNIAVNPLVTDWGPYRFTPLIVNNGDGTYDLTNAKTLHASESTMTAADSRAVLNQMWLMDAESMAQRLGDLRLGNTQDDGIWARYKRNCSHFIGDRANNLNANMFQAGYDKEFKRKDGKSYVGIAVDHIDGNGSYDNGSGDVKGTSVALYNTWIGNSGHYYDIVLKQSHYSNDYKWTDLAGVNSNADYSVNGTTLSGEYGYRKQLPEDAYVEPQAEIIYGHIDGADYKTSHKMPVSVDNFNHFITRLGVAVGKTNPKYGYYARASYYHDFGGGGDINFDNYFYGRRAAKNWGELTVGGDVKLKDNWRIYGEVSKYLGDIRNSINYELGAKLTF